MADYAKVSSDDSHRVSIAELVKDPLVVPSRMYEDVNKQNYATKLFRNAGKAESGVFKFTPIEGAYADDDPQALNEWAEIPLTQAGRNKPFVGYTARWGLGLRISEQTVRRNNYDQLAMDMAKVKNSWARFDENKAVTALLAALPTYTGNNWNVTTTATADLTDSIFGDVFRAQFNIQNADSDSSDGTGRQKLRFNPDTLVINTKMVTVLLLNRDLLSIVSAGNTADRSLLLKGGQAAAAMLGSVLGVNVVTSDLMDPNKAILLESGTVGFIAEEKSLYFSPLEFKAATRGWYTYGDRSYGIAVDNPKAGLVITGINGGSSSVANFT